jgi:hypothetical protein
MGGAGLALHGANSVGCTAGDSAFAPVTVPLPWAFPITERSKICQLDYESFTDSCLPADMNPGGRIPRSWVSRAGHSHGNPNMSEFRACRR